MNKIEWGPWRCVGMPELFDYIQVEGYYLNTWDPFNDEGFVSAIENGRVALNGDTAHAPIVAERWRLGKLPTAQVETVMAQHDWES